MQQFYSRWKQLTSGSVSRQIFGAIVIVGLSTVLVKFAAFIKDAVVAWRFGTGNELDAFLIALLVPAFIITVISESLNAALIPTYIQVREQQGKVAAQQLFSSAMIWGIGLLVLTSIGMVATAPIYLGWIAQGFEPAKLQMTLQLLWVITPSVLLSGIITLWSAVLNAGERFVLAALCPVLTPIMSIFMMIAFPQWGIFAFAAGVVLGELLEVVFLGTALRRQELSLYPSWHGLDQNLRQVIGQYLPMVAGALLFSSANFIDQTMAAMMLPGSVAALNYGNRLTAVLVGLSTTAISAAVIPYFSKMIAHENWRGVRHTLRQYLGLIFAITIPLTGILLIGSELIIRLLFQRGAFIASDTDLVAQIQICFALQIPFYVANILVVRLISSMRLNQILLWTSGFSPLLNIIFNYLFVSYFGIKGIALSTSCIYLLTFLATFSFMQHKLEKIAD
ncbi:virulence factor MviN [filamentous cyanobacterium LEGE 11480]|uniref:Virulence factor MviN n=2 Tax=Romeriopsis TaxID=2992131 RepID=A0A928VMQ6_9CYAN|nr:virulence factor MviN [Romeriopsis navalis LEGE 11480]